MGFSGKRRQGAVEYPTEHRATIDGAEGSIAPSGCSWEGHRVGGERSLMEKKPSRYSSTSWCGPWASHRALCQCPTHLLMLGTEGRSWRSDQLLWRGSKSWDKADCASASSSALYQRWEIQAWAVWWVSGYRVLPLKDPKRCPWSGWSGVFHTHLHVLCWRKSPKPLKIQPRLCLLAALSLESCFILGREGRKKDSFMSSWFSRGHNGFLMSLLLDLGLETEL